MTWELFYKAVFIGVLNAAPVGPVGILCLKSQLCDDRRSGLATATGMASGYLVVSLCVLLGFQLILAFFETYRLALQVALGLFLMVVGGRALLIRNAPARRRSTSSSRYARSFLQTFAMTLLNPVPFASFAMILTWFRVAGNRSHLLEEFLFASSVFVGTLGFWCGVRIVIDWMRHRYRIISTERVVAATGGVLFVLGSLAVASALAGWE